jgi:glycosyltransferase involved in cell wall biosynthesis
MSPIREHRTSSEVGRLLVVVPGLDIGGTELHLEAVLRGLLSRGWNIRVAPVLHEGPISARLQAAGVRVDRPLASPIFGTRHVAASLVVAVVRLAWSLRAWRPDIVHAFLPLAYIVAGLAWRISPMGAPIMSRRCLNLYQRRHRIAARLERHLHRTQRVILGNSHQVLAELCEEGVDFHRLRLLTNGVDLARFQFNRSRDRVRRELGLSERDLVIVKVANLLPYKGHKTLLAALAQLQARLDQPWVALMIGEDRGFGPTLRAEAQRLGVDSRLRWLGSRSDVPDLLAAADLACHASDEEGLPNAVLEAMAASLAVVVTDAGGTAEVVEDCVNGRVVPAGDASALCKAIAALLLDPALSERMGRAAHAFVAKWFALEDCIEKYDRLYSSVLSGGPLVQLDERRRGF